MKTARGLALPVLASAFAALISVGAYIALPLPGTPVPVVLQNLFIMLAALLLGPAWGLAATTIYLGLGALGLPVFSGGSGGLARFLGPTGGYLLGYIPAVLAMGLISRLGSARGGKARWWKDLAAVFLGSLIVYACGVPWLKVVLAIEWNKALAAGLLPFIPGDLLKMALAVLLAGRLRPILERALPSPEEGAKDHG